MASATDDGALHISVVPLSGSAGELVMSPEAGRGGRGGLQCVRERFAGLVANYAKDDVIRLLCDPNVAAYAR